MKKIILISFIAILLYLVLASAECTNDCGNGVLEPCEYCDKETDNPDNIVWFDDINSCEAVHPNWETTPGTTGLNCFGEDSADGPECQLDTRNCQLKEDMGPGGRYCGDCDMCTHSDSFNGETCTQRECSYQCPDFGNCFYTPGHFFTDECSSCSDSRLNECEDYENEFDCRANVCATSDDMLSKVCDWIGGTCKENLDCTWNCEGLYGEPDANGICHKTPNPPCLEDGGCCLVDYINSPNDFYKQQCLANNPADRYPDEIVCKQLQEAFPVFTNLNLFLSIFLLISYYIIIQKRKKPA